MYFSPDPTKIPQTLQSIFLSEPNDYDFIPNLSFNEIPSISTPPPSYHGVTNDLDDKTLTEIFKISQNFQETAEKTNHDHDTSTEIISPENQIFTPPFTTVLGNIWSKFY